VIDLRQNRGGVTEVAWHIIKHMVKDAYFLNYAWQTRINSGVKRANGDYIKANRDFLNYSAYQTFRADTVFIPDSVKRFNVPMVVIFSEMTVSAAEDFLIILKERKDRPMFIGRPSFGSTGSPLVLRNLPNGSARICTRRVLFPYSLKPFNEGIVPDIIVDYSFDEFMNPDLDKEMNVAVKEIKKQMR
jgi:carboxyl-terminal processing protease